MTEDEAKTKWCPFGFPSSHPGSNRWSQGHQDGEDARCIASACMAWRWKMEQTNKGPYGQSQWPMVEPVYRQTEDGRCGLAGG